MAACEREPGLPSSLVSENVVARLAQRIVQHHAYPAACEHYYEVAAAVSRAQGFLERPGPKLEAEADALVDALALALARVLTLGRELN